MTQKKEVNPLTIAAVGMFLVGSMYMAASFANLRTQYISLNTPQYTTTTTIPVDNRTQTSGIESKAGKVN